MTALRSFNSPTVIISSARGSQQLRDFVAPRTHKLFIAGDSQQRLYGPHTVLSRYGISIVGRSRRLTLNYRTTAQNLHYAISVLEGGNCVERERAPEEARYRSARRGLNPSISHAPTITEELDATAAAVDRWLKSGTTPETIAVFVHDRYQRDRVVKGLGERGIAVRAIDRDRAQPGNPVVMSMPSAKGTEFVKVVVVGVGSQPPAEFDRLRAMDETERTDAERGSDRSPTWEAAARATNSSSCHTSDPIVPAA